MSQEDEITQLLIEIEEVTSTSVELAVAELEIEQGDIEEQTL